MARKSTMATLLCFLLVAASGAGCLQDWIAPVEATQRTYACAFLDPVGFPLVLVTLWIDPAMEGHADPGSLAYQALDSLAAATGRPVDTIHVKVQALPGAPADASDSIWQDGWSKELDGRLDGDHLRLDILWLGGAAADQGGALLAPGILAVDPTPWGGATDPARAAQGTLRHWLGHALGVVNDGIPMVRNHEGAAKHSADPGSVMHQSWHLPAQQPASVNLTYGDDVLADWASAVAPEGVCA